MTDRPILRDPTIIKKADVVIMESTYGSRNHTENAADIRRLIEIILNTTRRGGNVVIPSFAVGRTQELIYQLNRFCSEDSAFSKEMRRIPVYVDSPMATTATEVFRANAQCFDDETRDFILKGDDPLDFEGLHFTRSTQESQQLNFDPSPKVILSASGMCEAGRIRHHLKHNLWNEKSSIVFVGYQAQGTLGRSLVEGVKDVTLFGEEIHVNAEIYNLQGFSGHADQNGLFSWLAAFQKRPAQIFLVHGEEEAKETFGKLIHDKLGYDPVIVRGNSEFELTSSCAELLEQEAAEQAGAAQEDIQRVRNQVAKIHEELEHVMYNANLAVGSQISKEKLNRINNMVQELDRAAISLGAAVGSMDRPREIKEGENA